MIYILPLLNAVPILISAVLLVMGWRFILNGNLSTHQRFMMTAAYFALVFFIIYITRTMLFGSTTFGGPDNIEPYYQAFLIFHIFMAINGLAFGIITIVSAQKGRIRIHRRLGPLTAIVWLISATTGFVVYLSLYVIWGPGPTLHVFHVISLL